MLKYFITVSDFVFDPENFDFLLFNVNFFDNFFAKSKIFNESDDNIIFENDLTLNACCSVHKINGFLLKYNRFLFGILLDPFSC